jgi:hypothetical protein
MPITLRKRMLAPCFKSASTHALLLQLTAKCSAVLPSTSCGEDGRECVQEWEQRQREGALIEGVFSRFSREMPMHREATSVQSQPRILR